MPLSLLYWENPDNDTYYEQVLNVEGYISVVGEPTQYYNSCDAFIANADAALQVAGDAVVPVAHDWEPNGQTYTGVSVPATPSTDNLNAQSASVCGAGGKQRVYTSGAYMAIETFFYPAYRNVEYDIEYRWIEDVQYIPVGDYLFSEPPPSINPSWSIQYQLHQDLVPFLQSVETIAAGPTDPRTALYDLVYAEFSGKTYTEVRPIGYSFPGTYVYTFFDIYTNYNPGPSVLTVGLRFVNYSIGVGGVEFNFLQLSQARLGEWHEETKLTITANENIALDTVCKRAVWLLYNTPLDRDRILDDLEEDDDPPPPPPLLDQWLVYVRVTCQTNNYTHTTVDIFNELIVEETLPEEYTLGGGSQPTDPGGFSYTLPGAEYNIQQGAAYNGYQTFEGSLCFDIHLKKWGKYKGLFNNLIEFAPINVFDPLNFSFSDMGMTAGIKYNSDIYIFDHNPSDSYMKWGRIGAYRLGFNHFLEGRVDFRNFHEGQLVLGFSLDGRTEELSYQQTIVTPYPTHFVELFPNQRARWMSVTVAGKYDVCYSEYRYEQISGRR
jgi:hypothetical protein